MRLKRTQNDFRVTEILEEEGLFEEGPFTLYRVTKRGFTTFEAADRLSKAAGVPREAVSYAGLKDKDGVTSQIMSVEGGRPVSLREQGLVMRPVSRSSRALTSADSKGNSFEIVMRDLSGDDMRRIRVNLEELRNGALPNYFDDQRFGCLRHGQGFIARHLLKGNVEMALRSLIAAPSPYGNEQVEQFKAYVQRHWGQWEKLHGYCRGRRGATVFEHLMHNPEDFAGAMERGISTRERTIHLFAYQSYLWNRAASIRVQEIVGEEDVAWLPGDASALPVWRKLTEPQLQQLRDFTLPLLGPGELSAEVEALYKKVFRQEGLPMSAFLKLDMSGFRPQLEERPFLVEPEFLRAAPAQRDDLYRRRQCMRVRFTLPRGQYATLVCKRLGMPTESGYETLRIWVARHPLDWPDDKGNTTPMSDRADRRHWSERGRPRQRRDGDRGYPDPRRDGPRRDDDRGYGGPRRDDDRSNRGPRRDDDRGFPGPRYGDDRQRRSYGSHQGGGGYGQQRDDRPRHDYRDDRPRRDDQRGGYGQQRDDRPRRDYRDDRPRRDDQRGGYGQQRDERPRRDDQRGPYGQQRDDRPRRDDQRGGYGQQRDERPRRDDQRGPYRQQRDERPRRDDRDDRQDSRPPREETRGPAGPTKGPSPWGEALDRKSKEKREQEGQDD